jgi:peptidoglycan hydrolase-like protein with peptidoglycan-binding domain
MAVSTPNRSIGRGLGPPELGGGTLIAYSAKGGTVAEDGSGRNSPFAKALLDNIEQPGLEIDFLFRKVRDAVLSDTRQRQEPFVYGSLPGEHIYLVPPVETAVPAPPAAPVAASAPATAASGQEAFAWQLASQSQDPEVVQDFIYAFPRGFYLEVALARLRELTTARSGVAPAVPAPVAASPAPPPAPALADRDVVIAIQQALQDAGCSPGAADGNWGPRSRAALARFSDADGLPMGSRPTPAILAVLKLRKNIRCAADMAATPAPAASAPAATGSCVTVSVRATPRDPTGDVWDWAINGNPEPDILISELTTGAKAQCDDSFTCSLTVHPVSDTLQLDIQDYDRFSANQTIGKGQCRVGQSCTFSNGTVSMQGC